ncbi:MAG: LamG domain-containing protein [Myxococcales bacterium]
MRVLHSPSLWLSPLVVGAFWLGACGSEFSSGDAEGGAADTAGQPGETSGGSENNGGSAPVGGTSEGGSPEGGHAGDGNPTTGAGGEPGGAGPVTVSYRQVVLDDQPLVYWRMGVAKNRVVPDETGGGNDLVLQGTGQTLGVDGAIEGDADGAVRFDGAASFAIATDARALDFADGAKFTLECWARREAGGAAYFQHLFSNVEGVAGNRDGFALYLLPEPATAESARSVFEYDRPAADVGTWGPVVAEDVWGHYVSVFDGKQAALYVNGTLASTEQIAGSIAARTVPFTVGRAAGVNGSYFKGTLDELAIYARALSAVEIAEHYGFASPH